MSNLRDLIRLEVERGNLSEPFKVKELSALIERNQGLLAGKKAPTDINSYEYPLLFESGHSSIA